MNRGTPRIVRRIDHVNVVVPDPCGFLRVLTERFALPMAWPWKRFPSFASGAANLGINIEAVRYAPGRPLPIREDAGLYAIACEPEPLAEARAELRRRGIPHSPPMRFRGRYPADANTPVFHRHSDDRGELWTLIFIGGLIGDDVSARRYARGIERGDRRLATLLGQLAGGLASSRVGARFTAQRMSKRPFVFLCKYNGFNIPEGHAKGLAELAARDGGPLGLVRTHELLIAARDTAAEADRWQRLLDPLQPTEPGRWQPGDGPAVRVVEGGEDGIAGMVWHVRSLDKAADWLRKQGMYREGRDAAVGVAPEVLQGLNVWLEADDQREASTLS